MTPGSDVAMMETSVVIVNKNDTTTSHYTFSIDDQSHTVASNTSFQHECMEVRFSELEYLPWDNPDNIVSQDVEILSYMIKNNVLGVMFLIGGPANIINMAVFYKQGLHDRVNLCLFALSLADELYLITAMLLYGEQLYLQFITRERFGPLLTFICNTNLVFIGGFFYVSPVLSAIIASERCLCVLNPLKFQTLLRTRTMAVIIIVLTVIVLGLFFIVSFRFRVGCIYDADSGVIFKTGIIGTFYRAHKDLIDFLDGFVFGVGLPGLEMTVVIITTIITAVKLRQIVTWRAGTSSSLSPREVALTKMLIGNSVFFIACMAPCALIRFSWLVFPEVNTAGRNENLYGVGLSLTEILSYINATVNILVYYVMGSRYREVFWALFRRKVQSAKTSS